LPDPLVGEYRIEIDGFLVKEGFKTNRETTVREMVALASVPEGTPRRTQQGTRGP